MKFKLHDIRFIIILHLILLFLVKPIFTVNEGYSNLVDEIDFADYKYVWLYCALSAVLCITILLWRTSGVVVLLENLFIQLRFSWVAICKVTIVWLLGLLLIFHFIGPSVQHVDGMSYGVKLYLHFPFAILILLLRLNCNSKWFRNILVFAIIGYGITLGALTGSKTLALLPFFIILICYSLNNRGIKIEYIIITGMAMLPFYLAIDDIRSGKDLADLELISRMNLYLYIRDFIDRYYGVDVVYAIYDHVKTYNPDNIDSLSQFFYSFMPSIFVDDKPNISFGLYVSDVYLGARFKGTGISASPTLIGELYANFGYVCFLVYAIFLLILRIFYLNAFKLNSKISKFNVVFFISSYPTISFFNEGALSAWLSTVVIQYAITFGIVYLGTLNVKSKNRILWP